MAKIYRPPIGEMRNHLASRPTLINRMCASTTPSSSGSPGRIIFLAFSALGLRALLLIWPGSVVGHPIEKMLLSLITLLACSTTLLFAIPTLVRRRSWASLLVLALWTLACWPGSAFLQNCSFHILYGRELQQWAVQECRTGRDLPPPAWLRVPDPDLRDNPGPDISIVGRQPMQRHVDINWLDADSGPYGLLVGPASYRPQPQHFVELHKIWPGMYRYDAVIPEEQKVQPATSCDIAQNVQSLCKVALKAVEWGDADSNTSFEEYACFDDPADAINAPRKVLRL